MNEAKALKVKLLISALMMFIVILGFYKWSA